MNWLRKHINRFLHWWLYPKEEQAVVDVVEMGINFEQEQRRERIREKWDSLGFMPNISEEDKYILSGLLEILASRLNSVDYNTPQENEILSIWKRRLHQIEWGKSQTLIFPCLINIFRGIERNGVLVRITYVDLDHFISYFYDFYWRHGVIGRHNLFREYDRIDIDAEFCSYLTECYLGLSVENNREILDYYVRPKFYIKKHRLI